MEKTRCCDWDFFLRKGNCCWVDTSHHWAPGFQQSWRRFGSEDELHWLSQRCSSATCRWPHLGPRSRLTRTEGRLLPHPNHTTHPPNSFHSDLLLSKAILKLLNKRKSRPNPQPWDTRKTVPTVLQASPVSSSFAMKRWVEEPMMTQCGHQTPNAHTHGLLLNFVSSWPCQTGYKEKNKKTHGNVKRAMQASR